MTLWPLLILAICFVFGVPVAFSMVGSVIPYFMVTPHLDVSLIIQKLVTNTESTSLMAAPVFIFAGAIMNYSGVTTRLMNLAETLVGHLTGGLGHVNILLSTLMGGLSGSGVADAAIESKLLVPEMEKRGYSKAYSGAVTAASACITPIIPPGVGLVVYAVLVQISVGKLLCAGYVPGFLMCISMMILNGYISKKRGYKPSREKSASAKEIGSALRESSWALVIPFGLIIGLRVGAFTATEGGAMIAAYSFIIGKFIYKEIKWSDVPKILLDAVYGTGPVIMVLCTTAVLSYYLSWERIPQMMTQVLISVCHNKYIFLLLVNILMLILGMFLDSFACMIIVAPLLAPVATAFGINLVHFGLVLCLNSAIGAITPPFGSYIFLVSGTIHCRMEDMVHDLIPYILVITLVLLICTYCPWLVTIVPKLVYGSV